MSDNSRLEGFGSPEEGSLRTGNKRLTKAMVFGWYERLDGVEQKPVLY